MNSFFIDVYNNIDWEIIMEEDSIDGIIEYTRGLNDNYEITDEEIIYYSNAMEYLGENDPSLQDSLEIASEYGYTLDGLNSETLASILKSRNNLEEFDEFLEELREKLEELEELEQ